MVTVSAVAVETMKFQFGISDCTVDSDVGTGNFLHVLGNLHVCGYAHVRSHMSLSMDCISSNHIQSCI